MNHRKWKWLIGGAALICAATAAVWFFTAPAAESTPPPDSLYTIAELGVPEEDLLPFPAEILDPLAPAVEDRTFAYFHDEKTYGDLTLSLLTFVVMKEDQPDEVDTIRCIASYQWANGAGGDASTFSLSWSENLVNSGIGFTYVDTTPLARWETEEDRPVVEYPSENGSVDFSSRKNGSGCMKWILHTSWLSTLEDVQQEQLTVQYRMGDLTVRLPQPLFQPDLLREA